MQDSDVPTRTRPIISDGSLRTVRCAGAVRVLLLGVGVSLGPIVFDSGTCRVYEVFSSCAAAFAATGGAKVGYDTGVY